MAKIESFQGTSALVTGASQGMGRLIALELARRGARVALVARQADKLEAVAAEVRGLGREAMVLACDVADRDAAFATAERARATWGAIDILVNNAGYGRHARFLDWDLDDIERMMRTNFLGSVYFTKALAPSMVERRRGWIVFIASVAGHIGVPDESAYAASKFAMVGLAEALSMELDEFGVHVLTVCPGAVDTEFFDAEMLARMPAVAKRSMIRPERVVDATFAALARGSHEITVPRGIQTGYVVRAIAPDFMRKQVKRTTLGRA